MEEQKRTKAESKQLNSRHVLLTTTGDGTDPKISVETNPGKTSLLKAPGELISGRGMKHQGIKRLISIQEVEDGGDEPPPPEWALYEAKIQFSKSAKRLSKLLVGLYSSHRVEQPVDSLMVRELRQPDRRR